MKISQIFMCVVFLILFSNCSNRQHSISQYNVMVSDSIVDIGGMSMGDTASFYLSCINTGNQKIDLDYVDSSCGCLNSRFQIKQLNPGDTSQIYFTFKPSVRGYVEKNIFIYFRQRNSPVHVLMKARVK